MWSEGNTLAKDNCFLEDLRMAASKSKKTVNNNFTDMLTICR